MQGRGFCFKKAKTSKNAVFADGAGGGSRTHTVLPPQDFKYKHKIAIGIMNKEE